MRSSAAVGLTTARPAVEALGDRRALAAPEHDGVEPEPREKAKRRLESLLVGARARRASRPLIRISPARRSRVADRQEHTADGRERLLPRRVLDDDGRDVPRGVRAA